MGNKSGKKGLLLAVTGLSGSGKSTLSKSLAEVFNKSAQPVDWIRTDVVRKELAGVPAHEKLSAEFYSSSFSRKTYAEFDRRIAAALKQGHLVIADGVFAAERRRDELEAIACDANAGFVGLWLDTPPEIMRARAEARKGTGDASDADAQIVDLQLRIDQGKIRWDRLDASGTPENTYAQALAALNRHGLHPSA